MFLLKTEDEKISKHCSLAADFHQMCNMPVTKHYPSCSGMYRGSLLSLLTVFKENPRVHTETVWPLTESCADWDFTSIKSNTHSPMKYFLCNCTCHSQFYFIVLLYM